MVVGRIRRKAAWAAGMVSAMLDGEVFLLGSKGLVRLGSVFCIKFLYVVFRFYFSQKS